VVVAPPPKSPVLAGVVAPKAGLAAPNPPLLPKPVVPKPEVAPPPKRPPPPAGVVVFVAPKPEVPVDPKPRHVSHPRQSESMRRPEKADIFES